MRSAFRTHLLPLIAIISVWISSAQEGRFTILSGDVTVTGRVKDAVVSMYIVELTIEGRHGKYVYDTDIIAVKDEKHAKAVVSDGLGWKDGYFFVRLECGGNAWRCNREQVFVLRGQGKLSHLGEVLGGQRGEKPGTHYVDGWFQDIYDKFELNDLTAHAFAPWMFLYSRAEGDQLRVDLGETWLRNRKKFDENSATIKSLLPPNVPDSGRDDYRLIPALLQNAVIAKYCLHDVELKTVLGWAEQSVDKHSLDCLATMVSEVIPGEPPRSWAKP
jgi:hypothetical protein